MDNLVHRFGFAASRRAARQFVMHGHVAVNGRKVDIPSMILKAGDHVEIRARPRSQAYAKLGLEAAQSRELSPWLALDKDGLKGEIVRVPSREEIGPFVNEQLVVELYSK